MARNIGDVLTTGLKGFKRGFGEDADLESSLRLELFKGRLKKKFETETMKPTEVLRELEAQERLNEAGLGDTTKGFRGLLKPGGPKLSETRGSFKEKFNRDVRKARSGEITWDDLRRKYPLELDNILELQSKSTPLRKSPLFKEGRGLAALRSPHIAKINPITRIVINNIKNESDYRKLLNDAQIDEFDEKRFLRGVNPDTFEGTKLDIDAIKEYFGRR